MKFKLVIAYDGTAYQGWQVQKIGTGVQEKIETAFGKMFPSVKRIHSSSRTDTGVHALGMVAHVEIPRAEFKMPARRLVISLNAFRLPPSFAPTNRWPNTPRCGWAGRHVTLRKCGERTTRGKRRSSRKPAICRCLCWAGAAIWSSPMGVGRGWW